jgi:starch synthase (maltosyl-transferring)
MQTLVPIMTPATGERLKRFVGDSLRFTLKDAQGRRPPQGWRAVLRTNLGRADLLRREIIEAHTRGLPLAGASWRDLPMQPHGDGWSLELPLAEVGYFKAKAYLVDPRGWQYWPDGPDFGISVHPDFCRTANTIYCAFTRLFGPTRTALVTSRDENDPMISSLDKAGYAVIPPSGKLRDLTQFLPHIIDTLGCRILQLLPINPAPTTYARFGRFGSPYATLDLTAVDLALVVFDKRTTGLDQFRELTSQTHLRGGRVFLDIVINHTGWGSTLQENHPEWFLRNSNGTFASPGAWGVTWEDLVELKHQNVALWDKLADVFLTWCHRGVDGFRCDAGYKVPVAAWQYIVARVQQEYPQTIFFLEGLGGAWEATEALLTDGGMQWAYSELFQNYSGPEVNSYLTHSFEQSERVGLLVHFSETHDNTRLAARGRAWSLLRNRLCALASINGGFGFTCGVEWLATEKIDVHQSTGLAWANPDNIVPELAQLNFLLVNHPCFFDGARITILSPADSSVCAFRRDSEEGKDSVLILINTDVETAQKLSLSSSALGEFTRRETTDLLGQALPLMSPAVRDSLLITMPPGAAFCLSSTPVPRGLSGDSYRRLRSQAAFGLTVFAGVLPARVIPIYPWRELAQLVDEHPEAFVSAVSWLAQQLVQNEASLDHLPEFRSFDAFARFCRTDHFSPVVRWSKLDQNRITPVPPSHWLLLEDASPFRATLNTNDGTTAENVESIAVTSGHVACFPPRQSSADATLTVHRFAGAEQNLQASLRFLPAEPVGTHAAPRPNDVVLLTNERGGMARMRVDLGRVESKYDCVLGANLHPTLPVDRHIFVKRIRVWVNADGFISPLDYHSLGSLMAGPPAVWDFIANAGDGRTVEIQMNANMLPGRNTTAFLFRRPTAADATGKQLPPDADVRLTIRVDIEDRNFHSETKRNGGADYHFNAHTNELPASSRKLGFAFTPAPDRQLRVFSDSGAYHPQPEWSENIPHHVEESRGQVGSGDAFSPGWFEIPLPKGANATLVLTADPEEPSDFEVHSALRDSPATSSVLGHQPQIASRSSFEEQLRHSARCFVVRRGAGKTVIAGYPWFLDWGRDTFIAARGLLAAGMIEDVQQILLTFARFEKNGTLPNTIFGDDASNRDTSDAPLWFGIACEELAAIKSESSVPVPHRSPPLPAPLPSIYTAKVDDSGRTLFDVLRSIGVSYIKGTPNGIRMDPGSALIWSPSHFTWMDTNHPAATPREGYPVEIQALWIRLLRQLSLLSSPADQTRWSELAAQATASLDQLFWLEKKGWYSDVLVAGAGRPAAEAIVDDALRSNCLFAISLGLLKGDRARRCVHAALRYLVVPGALRSLAPLPVSVPLPIYRPDGRLLNDPLHPYWGHYEGDEDTRRKPAYHNGTAWTWTFPVFCEALALAWDFSPPAFAAARVYLGSMERLLWEGCLGHLPEILDGDAPHTQRGCDAQAWSATEALRVWKLLYAHVI